MLRDGEVLSVSNWAILLYSFKVYTPMSVLFSLPLVGQVNINNNTPFCLRRPRQVEDEQTPE